MDLLAPIVRESPRFRRLLATLRDTDAHEVVVAAVRDADDYLADVDAGGKEPLPAVNRDNEA